jgi:pyruvate formate lyase activating enzyme
MDVDLSLIWTYLYIDIKQMQEDIHKKITGASNRLILANVQRRLKGSRSFLRIPVIPG